MDNLSSDKRKKIMSSIRSKNTKPEMFVRKVLHGKGIRFRIHAKDLPGKPDIVIRKYKLAIQVNGCFWHQHSGCQENRIPNSNKKFWKDKLKRNVDRDKKNHALLTKDGFKVFYFWECEIKNERLLENKANQFLKELNRRNKKG